MTEDDYDYWSTRCGQINRDGTKCKNIKKDKFLYMCWSHLGKILVDENLKNMT